ncbi:hypothetical protein AB6A40_011649 [Gnathostoma spinigerum]|uniref:Folliculin-interacting protein middle domain-containing protein n=1 Tax=Gnathostoma spinigerum TaxID=75299 RepID=A0ABD6EZK0_9BILA
MNHLAWVASVAPPERCQDTQRSLLLGTAADAEMLSVSYNASLAQFMEINGSVGGAVRLAHTVVLGSSVHLISEVLYVLSYFVRCSSIRSTGENASRWMKSPEMESFSPGSLHKLSEEASSDDTRTASEAHILPQADSSFFL